jgi:hypothetical protein
VTGIVGKSCLRTRRSAISPIALAERRGGALAVALLALLVASPIVAPASAGRGPKFRYQLVDRIALNPSSPTGLQRAGGIAVDQHCGEIYVGDQLRNRIVRFDRDGKFLNFVGREGSDAIGLEYPEGIFVQDNPAIPVNPMGPPVCSSPRNQAFVFVADYGNSRVSILRGDGSPFATWCNNNVGVSSCTQTRSDMDYYPTDVAYADNFFGTGAWVGGLNSGEVTEFRPLESTGEMAANRQTVDGAVNAPFSIARSGGDLWATDYYAHKVVRFTLDPANGQLVKVAEIGSTLSDAPGMFSYPGGVETAPGGPLFGNVYVSDFTRVQVFSERGALRSVIPLPPGFRGERVAVRYDGQVYATGEAGGVAVYSPGATVRLRPRALGGRRIELSGQVKPKHRGARLELQRLTRGFRRLARVRLDRRGRFRYVWRAPRKRVYTFRALFRDPHAYHANRASQVVRRTARP